MLLGWVHFTTPPPPLLSPLHSYTLKSTVQSMHINDLCISTRRLLTLYTLCPLYNRYRQRCTFGVFYVPLAVFTNSAPLGRVGLVVAMSVLILSPSHAIFVRPSLALRSHDHMKAMNRFVFWKRGGVGKRSKHMVRHRRSR